MLGWQQIKPLLQRDALTWKFVVRGEASRVGAQGWVALGVQFLCQRCGEIVRKDAVMLLDSPKDLAFDGPCIWAPSI